MEYPLNDQEAPKPLARSTAIKFMTLGLLALSILACSHLSPVTERPFNAATSLGLRDIHVRAIPLVSVGAVNPSSVTVFLYARTAPQNYFAITLNRLSLNADYSSQELYDQYKLQTVSANWDGRYYVESTQYPTQTSFALESLTEQGAVIDVSARLVHPESGDFIHLPRTLFQLQSLDLEALAGAAG